MSNKMHLVSGFMNDLLENYSSYLLKSMSFLGGDERVTKIQKSYVCIIII